MERVLGIRPVISKSIIIDRVSDPVPFRAGKVGAVKVATGGCPAVAFGNDRDEYELMAAATEFAVAINPDARLRLIARERLWPIQIVKMAR